MLLLVDLAAGCKPLTPAERRAYEERKIAAEKYQLELAARTRLGILEQEWYTLTPEKKLHIREEQAFIEYHEKKARFYEALSRIEAEEAHAESIYALYDNPVRGELLTCTIKGGNAKFGSGKWRPIQPTHFTIAMTDKIAVPLRRSDKQKYTTDIWVTYRANKTLEFCSSEGRALGCNKVWVDRKFTEKDFGVRSKVTGSTLTCRYNANGSHSGNHRRKIRY